MAIKAVTGEVRSEVPHILSPWLLLVLVAGAAAQLTSARSLQAGEAVPVIVTGVAATASSIAAGLVVFSDPLPATFAGRTLQVLAFIAVCLSVLLMPAPVRAAEAIEHEAVAGSPADGVKG